MAERPASRPMDPIAAALAFAIREAVRLRAERESGPQDNRRTIGAVDEMKRGSKAA